MGGSPRSHDSGLVAPGVDRWVGARPVPESVTACAAPFVVMDFDPYGNVLACCANVLFPLGNVGRTSLREIWNGPRARRLQQAVLRGDLGYGCGNCRHRLTYDGGEVPRDVYDHHVRASGLEADWPTYLGFSLHNTCNLACIMCGADASSRIRARRSDLPPLPHVYGDAFFEQLDPFLRNAEWMDFRGGEPFLVREHHRVWDRLVEMGIQIPCSVTTNGTVWNRRVEQVLEEFDTSIVLSYDGVTAETFERVREGSSFDTVMVNLERFHSYALRRGTDFQLSFSLVRQNWFELGAVLRFAEDLGVVASVHTVLEPDFGVQRLPTADLEHVVCALEKEGRTLEPGLTINGDVWRRELLRLQRELEHRSAPKPPPWIGEPPDPGNGSHVAATILESLGGGARRTRFGRRARQRRIEEVRAELVEWSDDGALGAIRIDGLGRVTSVELDPVLGRLAPAVRPGVDLAELFEELERSTGRRLWVSEEFPARDRVEHLLMLASSVRDRIGLVLRCIASPAPDAGIVVLIGVDLNLLPPSTTGPATPVPGPTLRRPTAEVGHGNAREG